MLPSEVDIYIEEQATQAALEDADYAAWLAEQYLLQVSKTTDS